MSHSQRTTRECTLAELRPELADAIRSYAQRQHWDNFESEILACCETTTERITTNRLDAWLNGSAATFSYVALIATPQRLIWAHGSDRVRAGAASARYQEMRLKLFTPKTTEGIAVDIYGRMDGTGEKTGGRFMLDDCPAAREFCDKVKHATAPLSLPSEEKPRRKRFRLF
ncbi:MAG TPA: hypothetical protein VMP08_16840 [Anaerolineae bacterium]|nr:hypothetical protein [Anaerolineae bacterium]